MTNEQFWIGVGLWLAVIGIPAFMIAVMVTFAFGT
jgi:uncharacterized membrane protein